MDKETKESLRGLAWVFGGIFILVILALFAGFLGEKKPRPGDAVPAKDWIETKVARKVDFTLSSAVLSRRIGTDFDDAYRGMNGKILSVYGRLLEVASSGDRATYYLEGDGEYKDIECVSNQPISSVSRSRGQATVTGRLDIKTAVFGGKRIIDSMYVTLTNCELGN